MKYKPRRALIEDLGVTTPLKLVIIGIILIGVLGAVWLVRSAGEFEDNLPPRDLSATTKTNQKGVSA